MLDRYDQDLLLDYLEGELDVDRRAQMDALLAEDPQLAALLNEMANDRAALRSLPEAEAPADLVHDVTKTLERRMLLDEPVEDLGPIPLSRGRAATVEPTRSISWGRVVGLTGLAASVALIAGVMVITFSDPLLDTANELAANTPADETESVEEFAIVDEAVAVETEAERFAVGDDPAGTGGSPAAAELATDDAAEALDKPTTGVGESLARGTEPGWEGVTPAAPTAPQPGVPDAIAGTSPGESVTVGTTAAISALQPRQQLVLFSESPEVSLEQLIEFCVANGIAVVKPEQLALSQGTAEPAPRALEEDVPEAPADEEDAAFGDYALLINETQLDTLVANLNTEVALDPQRAGKGPVISNQAALLTDLPEDDVRYGAYNQRTEQKAAGGAAEPDVGAPSDDEQLELANNANTQQALQLRNPDLGSPYANTRNRYNLQQQAGYGTRETKLAEASDRSTDNFAGDADQLAKAGQNGIDDAASEEAEADPAVKKQEDQRDIEAPKNDAKLLTEEPNEAAPRQARSIDPTRGNWLSAHLPVADTAPLLLDWRDREVEQQTKLVPVMVQRAEPEKVNTLRLRQQLEFANRKRAEEQPSEAAEEADVDSIAEDKADSEAPADAEPEAPAEPTK